MVSEKNTLVAVVMGSDSDLSVMQNCVEQLRAFGIEPNRFGVVVDGLVELAQCVPGVAALVVGQGHFGVDLDRSVEVAHGLGVLALLKVGDAPDVVVNSYFLAASNLLATSAHRQTNGNACYWPSRS